MRIGLVLEVLKVYADIDGSVENFKKSANFNCPASCGACCEKEDLEMTVLDFLPLAAYLWKTKRAEFWLSRLDESRMRSGCVFYRPDPRVRGNGRCGIYPLRGLICRLFGFSAVKDKTGLARLCACPIIKKGFPGEFKEAQKLITSGLDVPVITSFSMRLMCLEASLGVKLFPVNTAIKMAIEKIGFNPNLLTEISETEFPGISEGI